jgi:2-iminobutanoate/2-iminopropanoate deaminase
LGSRRIEEVPVAKTIHSTEKAPAAIGPYSQAVSAGGWLYLSGQIPIDPASGDLVTGSVAEQSRRVLDNLKAVVEAAGGGLADVVKVTVYLTDLGTFGEMNEVYAAFFSENPPARACVEVARLPKDVSVEMDAVARLDGVPGPG